ncbi:hypothetical protein LCGC14_0845580 [marine sediment metagenome]|uniref:Uncharacterized protein n=1 Tax=marine sediment metagenome TaxID=412755 RepID=A0A0F9PX48_9ZZZZ
MTNDEFKLISKDCPSKILGYRKGNRRCELLRPGAYNPLCRESICMISATIKAQAAVQDARL